MFGSVRPRTTALKPLLIAVTTAIAAALLVAAAVPYRQAIQVPARANNVMEPEPEAVS